MDDGIEALVGFVGAHCDAFELFEFAEEVLDQMTPFVHFGIERNRLGSARMLGDDDLGATLVEIGNDAVAVEGLVGDQSAEGEALEKRFDTDRIETLAWQQDKAYEVTERSVPADDPDALERQNFRDQPSQPASGACDCAAPASHCPSPHVASMSHGPADSRRKPLEINGSQLQHGATWNWPLRCH